MATIHNLEHLSHSAAYDETQCNDDIKMGDFIKVKGGVVEMVGAWPAIIIGESEVFHSMVAEEETLAARKEYEALEKAMNKKPTIASVIRQSILDGKNTAEVLEDVYKIFPNAKTSSACVAYYRSKMKVKAPKKGACKN